MKSKTGIAIDLLQKRHPFLYQVLSTLCIGCILGIITSPIFGVFHSAELAVKVLLVSGSLFILTLFITKMYVWALDEEIEKSGLIEPKKSKFQERLDEYLEKQKQNAK